MRTVPILQSNFIESSRRRCKGENDLQGFLKCKDFAFLQLRDLKDKIF